MAKNFSRRASDGRRSRNRRYAANIRDGELAAMQGYAGSVAGTSALNHAPEAIPKPTPPAAPKPLFSPNQVVGALIICKANIVYNPFINRSEVQYLIRCRNGDYKLIGETGLLQTLGGDQKQAGRTETPLTQSSSERLLLPAPRIAGLLPANV
jgi:hypothetical protein